MRAKLLIGVIICLCTVAFGFIFLNSHIIQPEPIIITNQQNIPFMNGVSLVGSRTPLSINPIKEITSIHAGWVALMPFAFIDSCKVIYNHPHQWWGERPAGILKMVAMARGKNLKILLKPHVWVRGQGWPGDFLPDNEAEWSRWEKEYTAYILDYARLADSMDIEAFCIGLEFRQAVQQRPAFWVNLIEQVRAEYKGLVTYTANWDNYQQVTFWDKLDFIGISAYFPLSANPTPGVEELIKKWQPIRKELEVLSRRHGKKVIFTEYGYRSIDGAAGNQWELEHHRTYRGKANDAAQQNAYEAIFKVFWHEPWFSGGFIWKWYPRQDHDLLPENSDYTPQNKPAAKIIEKWYQ